LSAGGPSSPERLSADAILLAARESGFTLAGLARAEPLPRGPLTAWLEGGMAASMGWMAKRLEERLDPARPVPGARTVLALACCFWTPAHARPSPIARYARGRDYHATLKDRLRALRRRLTLLAPAAKAYAAVDTGPVMERVWAHRAGLGWLGNNAMLLNPEHGSHLALAVVITDAEADRYASPHPDRCGRCRACLTACPTGALVQPGVVDSRRCLAYQTIEDRGPYSEALKPHAAGLGFGCDLCQEACPWNGRRHACADPRFEPRPIASLTLAELARLDAPRFAALAQGTAVARAGRDGLRRNALVALGAARGPEAVTLARQLLDDPDGAVRDAARWVLSR